MIYFSADTHFYHHNIIKYCNRPFSSVEQMNDTIIKGWNEAVTAEDTVYHLGDVTFKKLDLVAKLNGKKILVRGNHDRSFTSTQFKNAGFVNVFEKPTDLVLGEWRILLMHAPEYYSPACQIHLCGHIHDTWKYKDVYVNVGTDVWEFRPVTLEQILEGYGEY